MSRCRDKLLMSGRATHSHSQHGNFSALCIENKTFRVPFFLLHFQLVALGACLSSQKEPRRAELITPGRSRQRCAAREVKSEHECEATSCVCSALYCLLNWRSLHFLSLGSFFFFNSWTPVFSFLIISLHILVCSLHLSIFYHCFLSLGLLEGHIGTQPIHTHTYGYCRVFK